MLKIQFKDKRQDPIWIVERRYTIGSSGDNHLAVSDASLSPLHARLLTKDNKLFLKDNNTQTGSYVNERRVTEKQLLPGDTIRLGQVEFNILDSRSPSSDSTSPQSIRPHWSLVAKSGSLSGREFLITSTPSTLGRSSQCDICIPGSHLSRQHLQLTLIEQELHLRDLGSVNGTYLNDQRIVEAIAKPGDQLRLDVHCFHIIGPGDASDNQRTARSCTGVPGPVKRKAVTTAPKQWKTKPTSPGNRITPELEAALLTGAFISC